MKKILLILICFPLIFSCKKEKKKVTTDDIMEVKDDIIKDVNQDLNQAFDGGIVVRDMYEEGESTIVAEYDVKEWFPVSDEELKHNIKLATPREGKAMLIESGLNAKYRYYFNDNLVKEVMITADEW